MAFDVRGDRFSRLGPMGRGPLIAVGVLVPGVSTMLMVRDSSLQPVGEIGIAATLQVAIWWMCVLAAERREADRAAR